MSEVKRFDLGTDNTHYYGVLVIEECEDGDYVLSADYDALKAERDKLRAENKRLRAHKNDYMEAAEETRKALCKQLDEARELLKERDQLRAELAAIRSSEPDVQALVEALEELRRYAPSEWVATTADNALAAYKGQTK